MAAPRLRHAFRYPDSDSDADLPSAIDEQEQSSLISRLAADDRSTTTLFRRAFAALLALCFAALLALSHGSRRSASGTCLALASLSSSALRLLLEADAPAAAASGDPDRDGVPRLGGASEEAWWLRIRAVLLLRLCWKPLRRVVAGLLVFRAVARYLVKGNLWGADYDGAVETLAVGVYLFMPLLRYLLRPIDLSSLTDLKYNYKGA